MKRRVAAPVLLALLGSLLLPADPAAADAPDERSGTAMPAATLARDLIARRASLVRRPQGYPTTQAAPRRLASASVRVDLDRDRIRSTVVLRGVPTAATEAHLHLAVGTFDAAHTCVAQQEWSTPTVSTSGGWSRSSRTLTLDRAADTSLLWDCAFVAVTGAGHAPTYDVLGNGLSDVYARPDLKVPSVRLLGAKRLRLVPGVWTKLDVRVRNAGPGDALGTRITGSGNRVKVRTAKVGRVSSGTASTHKVQVKLRGKKRRTVRLRVSATGDATSTRRVLRPRRPPAKPRAGGYRSKDGKVRFRIRRATVTRFRAKVLYRCRGGASTWNTYAFPKARIPRNGIIDLERNRDGYTVKLQMFVAGGRATKGRFAYVTGAATCYGTTTFKARRR